MRLYLLFLIILMIFFTVSSGCTSDSSSSRNKNKGVEFLKKLEQKSEKEARQTELKRKAEEQKKRKLQEEYQKKLAEMAKKWQEANKKQETISNSSNVQYVLSDKDLTYIVLQKIMILTGSNAISVNCHKGVVKLYGESESAAMREKIIKTLKKLPGVFKIDASQLHIKREN